MGRGDGVLQVGSRIALNSSRTFEPRLKRLKLCFFASLSFLSSTVYEFASNCRGFFSIDSVQNEGFDSSSRENETSTFDLSSYLRAISSILILFDSSYSLRVVPNEPFQTLSRKLCRRFLFSSSLSSPLILSLTLSSLIRHL